MKVGLLHPGEMGVTLGAAAKAGGSEVLWASQGRSRATRERASRAELTDQGDLGALLRGSEVVICVCPPHAALDAARAVARAGYPGVYLDANAVSPQTALEIGRIVSGGGARFVDGGIIGPPATKAGTTRLYLSGAQAQRVADLFRGSLLDARVIGGEPGRASALKVAYAAWTKGSDALLLAIRALAAREGVEAALLQEWALSQPGLAERSEGAASGSAPKGWRFAGEMREIASTFADARLPSGYHEAAAEVYERLRRFKDQSEPPLAEVVAQLLEEPEPPA